MVLVSAGTGMDINDGYQCLHELDKKLRKFLLIVLKLIFVLFQTCFNSLKYTIRERKSNIPNVMAISSKLLFLVQLCEVC